MFSGVLRESRWENEKGGKIKGKIGGKRKT